jgi:hypothetical protein
VSLRHYERRLPRIPAGDVLIFAERATPMARDIAAAMEGIDNLLKAWPVASVLFLTLTVMLVGMLLAGH